MLVALGAIKTMNDIISLVIGVVVIAVLGELARRVRIGSFSRTMVESKVPMNAGR